MMRSNALDWKRYQSKGKTFQFMAEASLNRARAYNIAAQIVAVK